MSSVSQPEPVDALHDPDLICETVLAWREGLSKAVGVALDWDEDGGAPYATDKPDWDGYGAMVLLAAYDDHPDLRPGAKKRRFAKAETVDDPRRYPDAAAYKAIQSQPDTTRYPSIALNAQWWLPAAVPAVFEAPTVSGAKVRMGNVERLLAELRELNERTLTLSSDDLAHTQPAGPPPSPSTVDATAPFALAVFTSLPEWAVTNRQPLLMDY